MNVLTFSALKGREGCSVQVVVVLLLFLCGAQRATAPRDVRHNIVRWDQPGWTGIENWLD